VHRLFQGVLALGHACQCRLVAQKAVVVFHCTLADLLRTHQRRQGLCHSLQGLGACGLVLGLFLDGIPVFQHLFRGVCLDRAEYVGMADDQLVADIRADILQGEVFLFRFDTGVEYYLEQQVAQLFPEHFRVVLVDRLDDLIGLLDEV